MQWLEREGCDPTTSGDLDFVATGLTLSSQRVQAGDLYVALPGTRAHGADYAASAIAAGAVAVVTDSEGATRLRAAGAMSQTIVIDTPRLVLGRLSAWMYDEPASALRMVGVTGTQGKTTTTWLAEGGLQNQGLAAGVIGTVGTRIRGVDVKTALTTPEAPDLQALFAVMREQGVSVCLMEVSSHALVLGRVDGIVFDVAVFTNLGRDHLDFHADVEEYFEAKASLFTPARARLGLVNIDDPYGRRLVERSGIPMRTFSIATDGDGAPADWQTVAIEETAYGSRAIVRTPTGADITVDVPMPGRFNVSNAIAAIAACGELGIDPSIVASGISLAGGVPGRLEWISEPGESASHDFAVVVDYAHKPDALRAALETLRRLTTGRLIAVFGAGGDRDHGKRPLMGQVAGELADLIVITDDNPRSEDAAAIRAEIRRGTEGWPTEVWEFGDRRTAIESAIGAARPGDVVLIAGKGHETGQEDHGVVVDFDDRVVAREMLAR